MAGEPFTLPTNERGETRFQYAERRQAEAAAIIAKHGTITSPEQDQALREELTAAGFRLEPLAVAANEVN